MAGAAGYSDSHDPEQGPQEQGTPEQGPQEQGTPEQVSHVGPDSDARGCGPAPRPLRRLTAVPPRAAGATASLAGVIPTGPGGPFPPGGTLRTAEAPCAGVSVPSGMASREGGSFRADAAPGAAPTPVSDVLPAEDMLSAGDPFPPDRAAALMPGHASASATGAHGQAVQDTVPAVQAGYLDCLARIERLHRLLLDVIKDEFERLSHPEVTPVQALLLFNIGDHEVTAGELRSRGYYQGSNVSYNLKKLVDLGYLHHQRCAVDRRAVRIRLTPLGHDLRGLVAGLFARHGADLGRQQAIAAPALAEVNDTLRRLERFWSDQIRYIY